MDMSKYIAVFRAESEKNIKEMNYSLLALEHNPENTENLDMMFRLAHTFKGMAGTMGFKEIVELTHEMESLIDTFRTRQEIPDTSLIDLLFECLDLLEILVNNASFGNEGDIEQFRTDNKDSKIQNNYSQKEFQPDLNKTLETLRAITSQIEKISDQKIENVSSFILQKEKKEKKPEKGNEKALEIEINTDRDRIGKTDEIEIVKVPDEDSKAREKFVKLEKENLYYNQNSENNSLDKNITLDKNVILDENVTPDKNVTLNKNITEKKASSQNLDATKNITWNIAEDKNIQNAYKDKTQFLEREDSKFLGSEIQDPEIWNPKRQDWEVRNLEIDNSIIKSQITGSQIPENLGIKEASGIVENSEAMKDSQIESRQVGNLLSSASPISPITDPIPTGNSLIENHEHHVYHVLQNLKINNPKIQSSKISTEQLDRLMNLVGELVISRSRIDELINEFTGDIKSQDLKLALSDFQKLTKEIQEEVLEIRMISLDHITNIFPRMMRDLAKAQNKKIDFIIKGKEIKIDRVILEEIRDPLIHLLRNSLDHGIEIPKKRIESGKKETGTVLITASRQENYVLIRIEDDGKGIDPEEIRKIALERGIISKEKAEQLQAKNAIELIFLPGFSTSCQVTALSGRGVGMDIVKKGIERLGGSIKVESKPGFGSRFELRLPITIAHYQAMLVKVGMEKYAIPFTNIIKSIKVQRQDLKYIKGEAALIIDQKIIPLLDLQKHFHLPVISKKENITIVIIEKGGQYVGLIVDELLGRQEIITKNFKSRLLKNTRGFAGATILGDGNVILILDINSF
ncbi:MAG: chemotaxis protein CheW [Methanosarcina sp.]